MKNIILLTIDCLRQDALGMYGKRSGLTPFMDSLKDHCTLFLNAQAIGPYTQASFPGILTSSYALEYGWSPKCPPERVLVSEVMKKAGFMTAGFHSNPYLCGYFGWNRGWDIYVDSMKEKVTPQNPYLKGEALNKKVESWLSFQGSGAGRKPIFLWLHYMDVHEPYIPARRYVDMVDESIRVEEEEMFALYREVLLKRDVSDPGKVALLKKLYDAHVREADECVERFFSILKKLDLLENTTVILTADHGDEFNEHGSLSHDSTMYSELVNIPLVVYDADFDGMTACPSVVSNVDIPPTIAHLGGGECPGVWKGRSFLPVADCQEGDCFGEAKEKKGHSEPKTLPEAHYGRRGDLKIIYREGTDAWEMYDLAKDPGESENMVEGSPLADEMKEMIRPRIRRASK